MLSSLSSRLSSSLSFFPLRSLSSSAPSPMALNVIRDNEGARKKRKIVGRGIGSGRGKTCGMGHKGQRMRQGGSVRLGFEGGQTPLYKRIPKRGFKSKIVPFETVSVGQVQNYIQMGRLENTGKITMKNLVEAGIFKTIKHGVKLLGASHVGAKPSLTVPLDIEVTMASSGAIKAVEAAGGRVVARYHNKIGLRALLKPHKFEEGMLPRPARPPPKMAEFYTQYKHRGYLSQEIQLEDQMRALGIEKKAESAA